MSQTIVLSKKTTVEIEDLPGRKAMDVWDFIGASANPAKYMQAVGIASIVKINGEIVVPTANQKAFDHVCDQLTPVEQFKLYGEINGDDESDLPNSSPD